MSTWNFRKISLKAWTLVTTYNAHTLESLRRNSAAPEHTLSHTTRQSVATIVHYVCVKFKNKFSNANVEIRHELAHTSAAGAAAAKRKKFEISIQTFVYASHTWRAHNFWIGQLTHSARFRVGLSDAAMRWNFSYKKMFFCCFDDDSMIGSDKNFLPLQHEVCVCFTFFFSRCRSYHDASPKSSASSHAPPSQAVHDLRGRAQLVTNAAERREFYLESWVAMQQI